MQLNHIILQCLFRAAWKHSRAAAEKFGGKASQYFGFCLKNCWSIIHTKGKKISRDTPISAMDLRRDCYKDYQGQDVIGFYMSEKEHGIWAEWNGRNFYTRNGNIIKVPEWFKVGMPLKETLKGELYAGIGKFQELCSIVKNENNAWYKVTFDLFKPSIHKLPKHVRVIEQIKIKSKEHLKAFLDAVIAKDGEGVCITDGDVIYKLKPLKSIEVICVAVNERKIRSVACEMMNGIKFNLANVKDAFKYVGKKITIEFMCYTNAGKPFHARIVGERFDV
jgi:DNA ligase-1